jgi:hypothetical protein
LSEQKDQVLARLRELKTEHAATLGDAPAAWASGFTEDENITRKSYRLVVVDALESGVLTESDLEHAGLPQTLE